MTVPSNRIVGIALSGGGIRSASFSVGAVQILQERLGLIRGRKAARWLSAVSGGSYTASAVTLLNAGSHATDFRGDSIGGTDLPRRRSPLERGSPEVQHFLRHSRYLTDSGGVALGALLFLLVIINVAIVAAGFLWVGAGIANFGIVGKWTHDALPDWAAPELSGVALWIAAALGVGFLIVALFSGRWPVLRSIAWVIPLVPVAYFAPYFIQVVTSTPLLKNWDFLIANGLIVLVVVGGVLVVSFLLQLIGRWRPLVALRSVGRFILGVVLMWSPAVVGVLLVFWASALVYGWMDESIFGDGDRRVGFLVLAIVPILLPLLLYVPGVISPHLAYRNLLSRCFTLIRTSAGTTVRPAHPDEIAISSLKPAVGGVRYPELLICAAANISDRGATPAGSNVLPLVIGADEIRIPSEAGARLLTRQVEMLPARRLGARRQPGISLSSAVAIAGAAVSPAMGRITQPRFRVWLALLNVRLGVWLPNPLSTRAQAAVASNDRGQFRAGLDHLVLEMIGIHKSQNPVVYASDGGHYENLGLVELLRRNCTEIWAIDASDDPPGHASTLVEAIMIAEAELGCLIDIDVDRFALLPNSTLSQNVHATGTVRYVGGTKGVLHVVKLGLTEAHSSIIREYSRRDAVFPFHTTVHQVYGAERFEAYRRLGYESTRMAIAAR
jgi:hypothetical protein